MFRKSFSFLKLTSIVILLLCVLTQSAFSQYSGGDGKETNPYKIADTNDWQHLMSTTADWNKSFILTTDLDLAGIVVTPVGNSTTNFTGTFDGNDHLISNLIINTPNDYVGLFGYTNGAKIKNLGIEDANIIAYSYVGILLGYNGSSSIISDCNTSGIINARFNIGGLIGLSEGFSIENCYSDIIITALDDVGGLVGHCKNNICDSHSSGNITASNYTGGLAGSQDSSSIIKNCFSTLNVIGLNKTAGLVGYSNGTIKNCYASGNVSGDYDIGGLVGYHSGPSVKIENCYCSGTVTGSSSTGGFIGSNASGNIIACYSSGPVISPNSYGFAANNNGNILNTFWDTETSGCSQSAGGQGLSTAVLKSVSTYQLAAWAGRGWIIQDGLDYPRLQWQGLDGIPIPVDIPPLAGSGTLEDPYQICNVDDFLQFYNHQGMLDANIILMANLDLKDVTIYPIGQIVFPFKGVFNGNGNTISNVLTNLPNNDYVGLFSYVGSTGQIKNLNLHNFNITGKSNTGALAGYLAGSAENCSASGKVTGYSSVGGLIGFNASGNISDSDTNIIVTGTSSNVGGLVGYNSGTLISCFVDGDISGTTSIGGLVGYNYNGNITGCHANGTFTAKDYLGGLIGYNDNSNIVRCYTSGSVICSSPTSRYGTGGLIGYNIKSNVSNSSSCASVNGGLFVGGLIGSNGQPSPNYYGGNITDCHANGSVSGANSSSSYQSCIGGLIGFNNNANISSCYARGSVACLMSSDTYLSNVGGLVGQNTGGNLNSSYASGAVNGKGYIGGLVGCNISSNSGGNIDVCYAAGSVTGYAVLGGLVGYNKNVSYSSKISTSFATGNVSGTSTGNFRAFGGLVGIQENKLSTIENCFASGSVTGDYYTGGLVGANSGFVNNSYAVGYVTAPSSYVGGFIGNNYYPNYITSSFWDTQTSGKTIGIGNSSSPTGLTGKFTAKMKTLSTFTDAGWNFNNIWWLPRDKYPALQWTKKQAVIGSGLSQWQFPLSTYYCNARTQTIYLSSEVGRSCWITSLFLDVAQAPGQTLNNFTIRMKHTGLDAYSASPKPIWETQDWQIVYQANQQITESGWVEFKLDTPFDYNDAQNLMIDFSFDNNSWSQDGFCYYSTPGGNRTLFCRTDGEFGSPLDWTGRAPIPSSTENVPNIKLSLYDEKQLTPDLNGDRLVNAIDLSLFARYWNSNDSLAPFWRNGADLDKSGIVDFNDLALMASQWLMNLDPTGMTFIPINEIDFDGYMSKFETTNAQYCKFLNDAKASNQILVYSHYMYAASDSSHSKPYYDLIGPGYTANGAIKGGAARIKFVNNIFTVDSGFEDHPVTYVSWYGATAFCNYYGYQLPTSPQWQAVANFDGSYQYGCGKTINNSLANYVGSIHPDGTTPVSAFGTFGYGLADLAGNVWEFTSSHNDISYISQGGSWNASSSNCKISSLSMFKTADWMAFDTGFRPCIPK